MNVRGISSSNETPRPKELCLRVKYWAGWQAHWGFLITHTAIVLGWEWWNPFSQKWWVFFRFSSNSFLRGRRTGGRSGAILILSLWDFRCLAFCNHWLRCCKSLKRIITPALSLFASLWQAAKSNSEASEILRCSLASSTQALRVTSSSSFAAPFSPWIVRLHFRLWMSRLRVCNASWVAIFSTCCANADRADFSRSSIRRLVNSIEVSSASTVVWMLCMEVNVVSIVSRRSPISAPMESFVSLRIYIYIYKFVKINDISKETVLSELRGSILVSPRY